jgi:hypothetical protein
MGPAFEQDAVNVLEERDEVAHGAASDKPIRHTRRLSDQVLIAFHHACDISDLEVAERLLKLVEIMLLRRAVDADRNIRRNSEGLVAAHERLWHLRHPAVYQ